MVSRRSVQDRLYDAVFNVILVLALLIAVYPLYYVLIASVSDSTLVSGGEITLYPRGINFEAYKFVFQDRSIMRGYLNSLFYAAGQTVISLILTLPAAYALSRRDFRGGRLFMLYFVVTMYFSGGIIPFFVVIRRLGLIDSVWSLILPNAVNVFNIIVARTFFASTIPGELWESAQLDGCTNARFFLRIVLPVSGALVSIVALFNVVQNWNAFFHAMLFIRDLAKNPLQLILRRIIIMNEIASGDASIGISPEELIRRRQISDLMKYALIVVAAAPLLIVYPFVQKYFVKGVMIGSVKG